MELCTHDRPLSLHCVRTLLLQCKKAVGVGRANRAGFADIGKAYARMAKASSRMGDKSQAVAYLEDAQVTEDS